MLQQPYTIPALLILVLSIPLILELIPPNRFYGVRTPKTIANSDIWYRANRIGGWALLGVNALYLLVAAAIPNSPPPHDRPLIWLLHTATFVGGLAASLLLVGGYIRRLP